MNKSETSQPITGEQVTHERCPCLEIMETVRQCLGISPAVRQHLANSRVEFLKAIREILSERIDRLSSQPQQGTKVEVE